MDVKAAFNAAKFFVIKNAPTILTVAGTAATITGTVFACKGTLKAKELLAEKEEEKLCVQKCLAEHADTYSKQDAKTDLIKIKTSTAKELVKIYWPAGVLIGAGVAGILGGHGMLRSRNASLAVAYAGLDRAFHGYRDRVRQAIGEEQEQQLRFPEHVKDVIVEKTDEKTGEVTKSVEQQSYVTPGEGSPYAVIFDERSVCWRSTTHDNLTFLKARQAEANDRLRTDGFLFLNDVLEMLGLPKTQEGAVVGWLAKGDGDHYIDFGLFTAGEELVRKALFNQEQSFLLDFNVDGYILEAALPSSFRSGKKQKRLN